MAIPQTSNSASSAYIDAPTFFLFYSSALAGDMLRPTPTSPRCSYLSMIDPANPIGQRLIVHLNKGAGEIESACSIAKRYLPTDLQALTGVSQTLLFGLNAARALWSIYSILKPATARMEDFPNAKDSFELLKALRDGESIFSFVESQQAGLPAVNPPSPQRLLTANIVGRCNRIFANYGMQSIQGQSGNRFEN